MCKIFGCKPILGRRQSILWVFPATLRFWETQNQTCHLFVLQIWTAWTDAFFATQILRHISLQLTATHCNSLHHTATHCNLLQLTLCLKICVATFELIQNLATLILEKLQGFYGSLPPIPLLHTTTGWRRLIGSPKLQIIFHKRATNCRSLLRKMTYKDKGSYESSPPNYAD